MNSSILSRSNIANANTKKRIMMRTLVFIWLFIVISFSSYASDPSKDAKSKRIIAGFIKQQAKANVNIGRSVSTILGRYPEQVDLVIPVALELYPDKYEQIVRGAINAEPALACDVVVAAIESKLVDSQEIVRIAVESDPAYASEIVETAASHDIAEIQNIVRVAISTSDFHQDAIVESTISSFPEQFAEILSGAIQALPDQITTFVSTALGIVPEQSEEVVATAVSQNKHIDNRKIVDTAIANGMNQATAIDAALAGGAKPDEFANITEEAK